MAEEPRAETNRVLKHDWHLKPYITKEETRTLKELKQNESRVILTADKGVVMVMPDKQDYQESTGPTGTKGHTDHLW